MQEDFLRKQSSVMIFSSLCLIGELLINEINKE